jgi:hypothetical protein
MNDAFMLTAFLTMFGIILVFFLKGKKQEKVEELKKPHEAVTD